MVKHASGFAVRILIAVMMAWAPRAAARADTGTNADTAPTQWRYMPLNDAVVTAQESFSGKDPAVLVDGKLKGNPYFGKLDQAWVRLDFSTPRTIRRLALVRFGWASRSVPTSVSVSINGGTARAFELKSAKLSPGNRVDDTYDVLDLGKTYAVKTLTLRVLKAGMGPSSAGGFDLGMLVPAPAAVDLQPMGGAPADAIGMTLRIRADAPVAQAELAVVGHRYRREPEMRWSKAITNVPKGESTVTFTWSQLGNSDAPMAKLTPMNLYRVELFDRRHQTSIHLVDWSLTRDAAYPAKPAWERIKPLSFAPDAKGWRPGIPSDGFGRFGWLAHDGLLVGDIQTNRFSYTAVNRRGRPTSETFAFQCGAATDQVWSRRRVMWTGVSQETLFDYTDDERKHRKAGSPEHVEEPQRLIYSSLAPGFLVDSEQSRFEIGPTGNDGAKGQPRILWVSSTGPRWSKGTGSIKGSALAQGWLVIVWPEHPELPLLLALEYRPTSVAVDGQRVVLSFAGQMGRLGVGTPMGYRGWDGTLGGKDKAAQTLVDHAIALAAILRAYPYNCTMRFRDSEQSVLVRETFGHLVWGNDWHEPAHEVAPISPLLSFAVKRGYDVQWPDQKVVDADIPTKYGPYRYIEGDQAIYRLPIPPADTRLYPALATPDKLALHMADMIGEMKFDDSDWMHRDALNSWFYWASSSLALPLLNEDQRKAFLKQWRAALEHLLFSPHSWHVRTEPYSDAQYLASFGWVEGKTQTLGDVNSGIGAALYAPYAYARSSGDWALVEKHWPILEAALRYFLVESDWAQMQTGAREHSGSSSIDMGGIAYEGAVAFMKMAQRLGKRDDLAVGRLLVARLAVPTVVRWEGMHWVAPDVDRKDWKHISLGLSEFRGFDTFDWRFISPDRINGVTALTLAWVGQYPELYDLNRWGIDDSFWRWFEYDLVEKHYPDWRKNHPGNRNNHPANVCAHLYLRGLLGASPQALRAELAKQDSWGLMPRDIVAQENAPLYAMIEGKTAGATLRDWGRAAVLQFTYDADGTVHAAFECDQPFKAVFELNRAARNCEVNGVSRGGLPAGSSIEVLVPAGRSTVTLEFGPTDDG